MYSSKGLTGAGLAFIGLSLWPTGLTAVAEDLSASSGSKKSGSPNPPGNAPPGQDFFPNLPSRPRSPPVLCEIGSAAARLR